MSNGRNDRGNDRFSPPSKPTIIRESADGLMWVDYKDIEPLRRMMSPNGKIYGRKRLGSTAREQKLIAQAIKRARFMGLLPFTSATV